MIKSIIAKKTDIVLVPQCHFLLSLNIIEGDNGSYLGPRAGWADHRGDRGLGMCIKWRVTAIS